MGFVVTDMAKSHERISLVVTDMAKSHESISLLLAKSVQDGLRNNFMKAYVAYVTCKN